MNDNDIILGTMVEEIDDDDTTQTDLNAEIMASYDAYNLFSCIGQKVNVATLKYHLDEAKDLDNIFWGAVLIEIVRYYSLNPLKTFVPTSFHLENYSGAISDLLIYLKSNIPIMILEKKIKLDFDVETFSEAIKEDAPLLMRWCMKFIDRDSYMKFASIIYSEYDKEEVEI